MTEVVSRKRSQTRGLKLLSVARALKSGSGLAKCQLTKQALAAVVTNTELMLKELGEAVTKHLSIAKAKTVDQHVLAACIKDKLHCKGVPVSAAFAGIGTDRGKKDRRPIATASVIRCFAKGCAQGNGTHQIRRNAKDSLSVIAETYIRSLGHDAGLYTSAARRVKINERDIISVIKQRTSTVISM